MHHVFLWIRPLYNIVIRVNSLEHRVGNGRVETARESHSGLLAGDYTTQSTYIYRVHMQNSVWRLPNYWPPTPSPHSECVLPPPGGEGVGGLIFRKTPDIGLASYSIIPLRYTTTFLMMLALCTPLFLFSSKFLIQRKQKSIPLYSIIRVT